MCKHAQKCATFVISATSEATLGLDFAMCVIQWCETLLLSSAVESRAMVRTPPPTHMPSLYFLPEAHRRNGHKSCSQHPPVSEARLVLLVHPNFCYPSRCGREARFCGRPFPKCFCNFCFSAILNIYKNEQTVWEAARNPASQKIGFKSNVFSASARARFRLRTFCS